MRFFLLLPFLCITCLSYSQPSQLIESLTLESKLLKKDVRFSIYLPEGYERNQRQYPVLYLLHGYTDDETGWVQFGEVQRIADESISAGNATPMIIVMPDAGVSWYMNAFDGKQDYEDFFIKEFIPYVEKTYRIRSKKEFRAIAGLSMGGLGTLLYSLKYPELFAAAAPLSAAVWTDQEVINMPEENWSGTFKSIFPQNTTPEQRISEFYKNNAPLYLIRQGDLEKLKTVKFYIDCGDDDFLIKGNMQLHTEMLDKKLPHEFRVRDGGHVWEYWRSALPEVLKFVSASFHR